MTDSEYSYSQECLIAFRYHIKNHTKNHTDATIANDLGSDYMRVGIQYNNKELILEVLNFLNIPDNMDFKERLVYYQLLKEK